jgi:ribonuclease HIII
MRRFCMSQAVIKVKPEDLSRVEKLVLENRHAGSLKTRSEYEAFRIRLDGDFIIGYTSGKIVCSGFHAEAMIQTIVRNLTEDLHKTGFVIGSDEAGKGEWLGPLVIAAVAATEDQSRTLRSLGVMDSKDVPINRLRKIAGQIELECADKKILLIPPETFNTRLKELHDEGKNLNDLLAWGHAKVISELYDGLPSKDSIRVVIDEFAKIKAEQRLARVIPLERVELVQRPRAEDEIAVAAASILAREAREQWIDQFSSRWKLDLRELNIPEAFAHADKASFSKIEYLEKLAHRK